MSDKTVEISSILFVLVWHSFYNKFTVYIRHLIVLHIRRLIVPHVIYLFDTFFKETN